MMYDSDNPLAQSPGESSKANAALNDYAMLGSDRSLAKLVALYARPSSYVRQLQRWSADFSWSERVAVWDEFQRERARQDAAGAWQERRRLQRESEYNQAQELLAKAKAMLAFPLQTVTKQTNVKRSGPNTIIEEHTTITPARWSFRDAAVMLDLASKLARLSLDLETERGVLDVNVRPEDLATMTPEELDALEAKLRRRTS